MTRFNNDPSPIYHEAVSILTKLLKEEGESIVTRAFADATYEEREINFGKIFEVKESKNAHVCINHLLEKKCSNDESLVAHAFPGGDHLSEWVENRRSKFIVSQPYGLSYSSIKESVKLCEENGLEFSIDATTSWHFPGRTLCVQFEKVKDKK